MPSKNRRTKHSVLPKPTFAVCTNVVAPLHRKCADVLAWAIHLDMDPEVKMELKQSLARLGLWGYGLQDAHLNQVLNEFPDIEYAVIQFLNLLASLLIKDVVPFLTENISSADSSATGTLAADLAVLSKIAECHLETMINDESEDSDSDDEDRMDVDIEFAPRHIQMPSTTASKIKFYVSRLMDLLPAIEAVLEAQHLQRESLENGPLGKQLEQHDRADLLMSEQKEQRREKLPPLKLDTQRSISEGNGSQMESVSRPKIIPSASFPCESSIEKHELLKTARRYCEMNQSLPRQPGRIRRSPSTSLGCSATLPRW